MSTAAALQQQVANLQESLVAIELQRDELRERLEEEAQRAMDAAKLQKQLDDVLTRVAVYEGQQQLQVGGGGGGAHGGGGGALGNSVHMHVVIKDAGRGVEDKDSVAQQDNGEQQVLVRPPWADALLAELRAHARFQQLFLIAEQAVVVVA